MSHLMAEMPTPRPTPNPSVRIQKHEISSHVSLMAGSVAGGIEAGITVRTFVWQQSQAHSSQFPFEFAKTRVQLQNDGGSRNPLSVMHQVVRNEGIAALYKGCLPLVAVGLHEERQIARLII